MSLKPRLLGLAFAAADALVEVDAKGMVALALGSGPTPENASATWMGRPFATLLAPRDQAMVTRMLGDLTNGSRTPPAEILMDCGDGRVRRASFRAFMLPEIAPAVSCALIYMGAPFVDAEANAPLLDGDAFVEHAKASLTDQPDERLQKLALAFIEIQGLEAANDETGRRIASRIGATLRSAAHDGASAAQLTAERYAVVKADGDGRDLAAEVREAGLAEGVTLTTRQSQAALGSDPLCALRALRFAIEGCLKDGGLENPELAFADSLARTMKDATRFRGIVETREFALFYQPIVDLKTRAVHHFEALARFGQGGGPAPAIRMAEEMALIEGFDLAVAEKAVQRLRLPGSGLLKIAINVSGASLASDAYVQTLLRITAPHPEVRRRLMVEVTETAALADLAAADRRLRALREAGMKVCIDDFGAGSASFDYLHGLSVDAVKIDGAFVRDIVSDPRGRTLVGHLVELCASLNLDTIAEMIETEEASRAVEALGVGFGQGWLYGKPEAEPRVAAPVAQRARRRGEVEAWG